jgi:hypothetical protein
MTTRAPSGGRMTPHTGLYPRAPLGTPCAENDRSLARGFSPAVCIRKGVTMWRVRYVR